MKRTASGLIAAGMVGLLMATAAGAAEPFDSKRFFDELGDRGGSVPSDFNGKVFFEDLERKGISSGNRVGPKRFFDELQSQGVSVPDNFDGRAFFEDLERKGIGTPEVVDMRK